ncbi:hypothetical protein Dimus_006941 [Dionaea muscipula]
MENLSESAAFMSASLQKNQTMTDNMVSVLGSFDLRRSSLETAMRPTQLLLHSFRRANENIDKTLKYAEAILEQFDLFRKAEARIQRGPHEDLESYLQAIDQLRANAQFFGSKRSFKDADVVIDHVNTVLQEAILKLGDEFKDLLSSHSTHVERDRLIECLPPSLRPLASPGDAADKYSIHSEDQKKSSKVDDYDYILLTLVPHHVVPLLHNLAHQMVQAGNEQQVLNIYREARIAAMDTSLRELGIEKLNKNDVQRMKCEAFKSNIGNWILHILIAVKLLFPGEKQLCDQVLKDSENIRALCFAEVTADAVAMLLSVGDALVGSKRLPENLFLLLDMYETMWKLQPEIESIFEGKPCNEIRENLADLTKHLAQTAQETLVDFEAAVRKDATRADLLDGTVHPLTGYVVNYVKFVSDYRYTLKLLLQELNEGDPESKLASVITRILQALQHNLVGKSKHYIDTSLSAFFLMNNIHYMVRSVRRSEATKHLLGDDWVQRHRKIVQLHANDYKKNSWGEIRKLINIPTKFIEVKYSSSDGSELDTAERTCKMPIAVVKNTLEKFNIIFEELHQRQSQWSVPDSELRECLRLAVAEVLIPAYRNFLDNCKHQIEGTPKNCQKYRRYAAEDIERKISELFRGKDPQVLEQKQTQFSPSKHYKV